jgi:hypothetical protein
MDPVPDALLLRKSGSYGNRTRASGSVARNSDHQTTEAVDRLITGKYNGNKIFKAISDGLIIHVSYSTIFDLGDWMG